MQLLNLVIINSSKNVDQFINRLNLDFSISKEKWANQYNFVNERKATRKFNRILLLACSELEESEWKKYQN